jgi:two-component system nitrogen regulation response regulator GlnG
VRQLENLCHWLTVMAPGQVIDLANLPPEFRAQAAAMPRAPPTGSRRWSWKPSGASRAAIPEFSTRSARQFERALISKALARTGGRRIDAANLLGMGRNTITRKIQELGIEDNDGRGNLGRLELGRFSSG